MPSVYYRTIRLKDLATLIPFAVLLFSCLFPATLLAAEDSQISPLQPADTSSPRDTLASFLRDSDLAVQALTVKREKLDTGIRERMEDTFDFSDTPNHHLFDVRIDRLMLMKEVLDRIKLPAWEEIPGDQEVANRVLSAWTVPGTRISIERLDEGERAGEFVFSADSIARLPRYYRLVKQLPYVDEGTISIYEAMQDYFQSAESIGRRMQSRLDPLDTSNPRSVLQAFQTNMNRAHEIIESVEAAFTRDPSTMSRGEARVAEQRAQALIDRAVATLDLRDVAVARRQDAGLEVALLLKEILDRAPLPQLDAVPGMVTVDQLRGDGVRPVRWFLPNTDIEIVEITDGLAAGEFRFSSRTVLGMHDTYFKVQDLPYRGDGPTGVAELRYSEQYDSPHLSRGFYSHYISTPGQLIPQASPLWPLLRHLPQPLNKLYGEQTLWQWLAIGITVVVVIIILFLLHAAGRWVGRNVKRPWAAWVAVLEPVANAWVAVSAAGFLDNEVNVTGELNGALQVTGGFLLYLFSASAVFRLSAAIADTIVELTGRDEEDFDSSLLRVSTRSVGFIAGISILVIGVQRLGLDLLPLIAGIGVGGLAVALAIRPTLENMIGGMILYADRPVRVGDYCSFDANSGVIERIGLRSTRIRALDRTLITVPNSVFADMQITNWAQCDTMQIKTVIGLRYETTPDQLRHVMAKMRRICFAHPKIQTDTLRIRFAGFGASSLDVAVRVYVLTQEWNEYHAVREDLYLRFLDAIAESGTSVAFPSTTMYLGSDEGLDPQAIAAAEKEVEQWREEGELPFPLTPEPLATRIEDTLDYPPKGSPQHAEKEAVTKTSEHLSTPKGSASVSDDEGTAS